MRREKIPCRQHVSPTRQQVLRSAAWRSLTAVVAMLLIPAAAVLLTLISGPTPAGDTQVYKTVDAQGNIVYTDKPSSPKASKTSVQVHEPSAEDLAQLERQRAASQAAEAEQLRQALADRANRAQQTQLQRDRQTRCQNARNHFYALKDAGRIYQRDAQGNRVYLPDDAADAKRAEARKAMEAACAP